jgi:hypothetical protein
VNTSPLDAEPTPLLVIDRYDEWSNDIDGTTRDCVCLVEIP